jgi:hypothetical protein
MNEIERVGDRLRLRGRSHELTAMQVDGYTWVGLLHIDSPTDGALLEAADALALRDWLNERLLAHASIDRPEHDDRECRRAAKDAFLADLCRSCYVNHTGLRP